MFFLLFILLIPILVYIWTSIRILIFIDKNSKFRKKILKKKLKFYLLIFQKELEIFFLLIVNHSPSFRVHEFWIIFRILSTSIILFLPLILSRIHVLRTSSNSKKNNSSLMLDWSLNRSQEALKATLLYVSLGYPSQLWKQVFLS